MANTIDVRSKAIDKQSKKCKRCQTIKPIQQYYGNKDWDEQFNKDCWCKECVKSLRTKMQIKEYCFYNNRKWTQKIWDLAKRKALKTVEEVPTYQKMSEERKAVTLERITCQQIPTCLVQYYTYEDHKGMQFNFQVSDEDESTIYAKQWNDDWDGSFTKRELQYLENYYARLTKGKILDDTNKDYIRKICRASMQANRAMDEYAAGKCEYSIVKDALNVFDMLNKSANLAACKRKEEQEANDISICQISKYIEEHGLLVTRKIEWPKDSVDLTIEEFRYTVQQAIGEET